MCVDKIFSALSSTVRRQILAYLAEADLTASEIAEHFEMSKPAISKHLSILENAGLVKSTKKAQFIFYTLENDNLVANVFDFLVDFCPAGKTMKLEGKKNHEKK